MPEYTELVSIIVHEMVHNSVQNIAEEFGAIPILHQQLNECDVMPFATRENRSVSLSLRRSSSQNSRHHSRILGRPDAFYDGETQTLRYLRLTF